MKRTKCQSLTPLLLIRNADAELFVVLIGLISRETDDKNMDWMNFSKLFSSSKKEKISKKIIDNALKFNYNAPTEIVFVATSLFNQSNKNNIDRFEFFLFSTVKNPNLMIIYENLCFFSRSALLNSE